jgi:hypothetical protein
VMSCSMLIPKEGVLVGFFIIVFDPLTIFLSRIKLKI